MLKEDGWYLVTTRKAVSHRQTAIKEAHGVDCYMNFSKLYGCVKIDLTKERSYLVLYLF